MKITFAIAPVIENRIPVIGVPYLAALLRSRGHEVAMVDLNVEHDLGSHGLWTKEKQRNWSDERFVAGFVSENPELMDAMADRLMSALPGAGILGFSVWGSNSLLSIALAGHIKKKGGAPFIVMGGHEARNCFNKGLAGPFDALVFGEGELAMLGLTEYLSGARSVPPPGTAIRSGSGWDIGPPAEEVPDLDSLPFPDFSGLPLERYTDKGMFPISFNRGCFCSCAFCSVHGFWKSFRSRGGASLYAEYCNAIEKYNAGNFEVSCAAFNLDMAALEDFCDRVIAGGAKANWGGFGLIRPEMDERMARKLARAGCDRISFGLESASDRVRGRMRKWYDADTAQRVLRACSSGGIRVVCIVMIGFPGETAEDIEITKRFLERNKKYIFCIGSPPLCHIEPNSPLMREPARFGLDPSTLGGDPGGWRSADGSENIAERTRTAEEFIKWAGETGIPVAR